MSFTRLFYDKEKVNNKLEEDYNNLKYNVNVPGNSERPYFIDDPQIRLQKFGANLSNNLVDINSSLLGIDKKLSRHYHTQDSCNAIKINNNYSKILFPSYNEAITDEPRLTMPAWNLRDQETNNWTYLHYNPQLKTEITFDNNISSRILEKDNYRC
tara:strand:- start:198 stop:665 length:468 start_codon:yes stop_codon:yes gene_type:complete